MTKETKKKKGEERRGRMADVLDFRQEHAQQQVHLRPMAAACGRKRTFGEATNLPQQHEQGTCGFKRSRGIEREGEYLRFHSFFFFS